MAGQKVPLTFRIYKGNAFLREEVLSHPVIKIGKLSSSHLRLDDESVTRMHAVIEVAGSQEISIIDLGSTKGTQVNGQKVNKAKLQHGDRITLGDIHIELSVGEGASQAASSAQPGSSAGGAGAPSQPPPAPGGAPGVGAGQAGQQAPAGPAASGAAASGAAAGGAAAGGAAGARQAATSGAAPGGAQPGPAAASQPGQGAEAGPSAGGAPGSAGPPSSGGQAAGGGPPQAPSGSPPPTSGPPPAPGVAPPGAAGGVGTAPSAGGPAMPGAPPPPGLGGPGGGMSAGGESVDELGGARSVEVAAMFGGSVLGVKHVSNPRGGKITPATYGMLVGGAVLLLLAIIAFGIAVMNSAQNQAALEAWLADNRPYHEFRPERISLVWDWVAVAGLLGGVACIIGGLFRWRDERIVPYYKVGSAEDVDFALSEVPDASFPLVAPSGDDFVLNVAAGMDGEMTVDGKIHRLSELQNAGRARPSQTVAGATEVPIPEGAKIHVNAGKTTFVVSPVPKPKRYPVPLFASMERSLMAFVGGTAAALGILLILINTIPPDPRALALDGRGDRDRDSRVHSAAHEDPLQEEEDEGEAEGGDDGVEMELDEGEMGEEEAEVEEAQAEIQDRGEDEPQVTQAEAVEEAREAGIAGQLAAQEGEAFASLADTGDFTSGLDDRDIQGGLLGDASGAAAGDFGGGVSGGGPGGGGTGWGTVGTGQYGTIGGGEGTGEGYGRGDGGDGLQEREGRQPEVHVGDAQAEGELAKEIIRRYIRRQLDRIRHCYERELQVHDGLSGTVTTQFQISPNGSVMNANASGIGNNNVESCVADAIQAIQFPAPEGGGIVNVNYPFTFQPSG